MDSPGFQDRAARLLRSAANDLKRDDGSAEADLGLSAGEFAALTAGRKPITWELIGRAAQVWPLNERDLLPAHDDCPDGVTVFPADQSKASSRILSRGGAPYYEYRDTAMSRVASFRPEWIRMLCVVDDPSVDNPALRWNNGHLLYQFTYFVGPVNYYYRWQGTSYCEEMNTGDSVWGLPFAPHTFAARSADEPAYILALTYGGGLPGDAQRELSVLGPETARQLALPVQPPAAQGEFIRSFLDARLVGEAQLAWRSAVGPDRLGLICSGEVAATEAELTAIAAALDVSPRDLLPATDGTRFGVHIRRRDDAREWRYPAGQPAYTVTELAGDPLHPHTTSVEVSVEARQPGDGSRLVTYQHQYLYVLGDQPLTIHWEHRGTRHSCELAPGDSCYVLPQVPIALRRGDAAPGRVLMLRIGGAVTNEIRFALSTMAAGGIDRYVNEDRLWYSPGGAS